MYKKLTGLSILIVDDDPFIIQSVTRLLKDLNINNITSSTNALLALEKLNSTIDVVISDLKMPDLDGIQLIRHLSIMPHKVSLILISGESEHVLQAAESIAVERKVNILGTLHKPIQSNSLISILNVSKKIEIKKPISYEPRSLGVELKKALQNQALSVHYQPQLSGINETVIGIEALARWKHKEMGMIPPTFFIPQAENLNLISLLTQQIIDIAFEDFSHLVCDTPWLTISINFSHDFLTDLDLPEKLEKKLKQHNLVASQVMIEITESVITQDLITSLDILARLRLKGFGLSIDDFGTGAATMEQIDRIPFTELKIDRAFVHGATKNKVKKAILESSMALAKSLSMRTVAEGVEDKNDLQTVKQLGCDLIQGFYYAKPMPIDGLCTWIASRTIEQN